MPHWMKMDLHARQSVCEGRGVMMGDYLAYTARWLGGADGVEAP